MPDIMISLRATAYAKLNLALHVTGQRADGYHLLDTLVAFADYGDEITVTSAAEDSFSLSGRYGQHLPTCGNNLVLKARDALREHFPRHSPPVAIHLQKNLPVASGIGGGSSDAASVLALLLQLWDIAPKTALIEKICLSLGADVPMCLHGQFYGGGLIARGIGEQLHELPDLPVIPLVLVNDGTAISTPQIFQRLQKRDNAALADMPAFTDIADICAFLKTTRNDLYAPACSIAEQLPQVLNALVESGAAFAQMSGSGATCFGIYDSLQKAQQAADILQQQNPHWFVQAASTVPARI